MSWRVAKALLQLKKQVDNEFPTRKTDSDGTIGDASHASRSSDHNPWVQDAGEGVVTAMDITNDPAVLKSEALAQALIASRDPRIKYIISNRRIYSGTDQGHPPWEGRPYTGANPHDHHVHISVKASKNFYDDVRPWNLSQIDHVVASGNEPKAPEFPLVQRGSSGPVVQEVQKLILASEQQASGDMTDALIRAYQRKFGMTVDGKVGPQTWKKLKGLT